MDTNSLGYIHVSSIDIGVSGESERRLGKQAIIINNNNNNNIQIYIAQNTTVSKR